MLKDFKTETAKEVAKYYIEMVRSLLAEHFGPKLILFARDDLKMRRSLKFIHRFLPLPIRVLFRRERFVEFCMKHKDELLAKYADSAE